MKKYLIAMLFALSSLSVFAKHDVRLAVDAANQAVRDAEVAQALRDIQDAAREAHQDLVKSNLSTQKGKLCYGHDGFTRDMIEARKNGIEQEELQLLLFQQFNQNAITIDVLKEMTTVLKGAYLIPDEIIDNDDKLESFLQNMYWRCMNSSSKK